METIGSGEGRSTLEGGASETGVHTGVDMEDELGVEIDVDMELYERLTGLASRRRDGIRGAFYA